ncbi:MULTISPECIES: BCCT family transporter [unclassified Sporosarcina]|uniref:BCCT family transporter n=1 Tax=unclassified Sporosarcina TaxID=2647733 RepID=UPI0009BD0665|nr:MULTISPECIES: BCCT family transporter [unclassified Sporosarcina]ARD47941.1 glycine/betaine ABC transporter [Sporosarcina sp. P33]PID18342.1 glycine/betaine ABC transporter [Sporosarcina sp. P35]
MTKKIDTLLITLSLALVLSIVGFLYVKPEESQQAANSIFGSLTEWFGSSTLIFTFLGILLLGFVAVSKYGNIRLGNTVPEYTNFKWISMMIACGLGSATVYWAFIEWAYYIDTPGLGIEPGSQRAFEMALPYNMFHWGVSAWTLYALVGLPICYHLYVRKNKGLSLSAIVSSITGIKQKGVIGRIVDIMFIFICFGGLSITLGVSVPLVSAVLSNVLGLTPSFKMNLLLILMISVIYSLSSYIGLQKGMARISDMTTKLAILFCIGIIIVGPGLFIIANSTNALGQMMQNFVQMSLFTDPIGKSGFPQSWTIFYWLYWITYAPFTGIFIAKVSKGRTLRSVILNTLISGSVGCFFFFGVIGSLSIDRQMSGKVDMVGMLAGGNDNAAIIEVLKTLPLSGVFMVLFAVVSVLFLASTLDGAAFTMASTATPGLGENEEPHPLHRLFWCVMLAVVPLTMIFIGADLNTIKTSAIITGVPVVLIMAIMAVGWVRWMVKDFGSMSAENISKFHTETGEVAEDAPKTIGEEVKSIR